MIKIMLSFIQPKEDKEGAIFMLGFLHDPESQWTQKVWIEPLQIGNSGLIRMLYVGEETEMTADKIICNLQSNCGMRYLGPVPTRVDGKGEIHLYYGEDGCQLACIKDTRPAGRIYVDHSRAPDPMSRY